MISVDNLEDNTRFAKEHDADYPILSDVSKEIANKYGVLGRFGGLGGLSLRLVLPTLVLAAGLFAIWSWQEDQRANDVEEIDAMLLTDDLPIDAYLDKGFEAWLRKVSNGPSGQ